MARAFEASMRSRWVPCIPSDSTDLTGSIGLYVGGSGDVLVRTLNNADETVTFSGVIGGTFIPGNFTRVMAATVAASILVAYP